MEVAGQAPDGPRRGSRLLVLLPAAVFAGLVALFAVRLFSGGDPSKLPSALIGAPAPRFDLPPLAGLRDASGRTVSGLASTELTGGVTVLNVWASWCAPCREEHPVLMDLARETGFRLVGIDYKDKDETARRFLGALGNPFAAVGVDASGRTGIDLGVYGVPETYVVGPDSRIRYKQVGPLTAESLPGFLQAVRDAAH